MKKLYSLLIVWTFIFLSGCNRGTTYHLVDGKLVPIDSTENVQEQGNEKNVTPEIPEDKKVFSAEEIYENTISSVVEITAKSAYSISTGSGFFFDDKGTVITNYHVIEDCQTAEILLSNGRSYKVTAVLGYDKNRDIAILSTACNYSKPLEIRTSIVKTGEKVYAIGSSLGLTGTLSDGLVSAVDRKVNGKVYIQTTAPVSHGNSGGPLVDETGQVIGIISASIDEGQNLNLAIPIEAVYATSLNDKITLDELFKREVTWLSNYRFSYYEEEAIYVLLFQLADQNEIPMSATGTVKIRIVNDNDETVYNKSHHFSDSNFEKWIYDNTQELYLGTISIPPQNITDGTIKNGTVYFEISTNNSSFDECEIPVFDLPVVNVSSTTSANSKYTFNELAKKMYTKDDVNVRDLPTKDGKKIGAFSKGQLVVVTGQCKETNWYRIIYEGVEAYVSDNYLIENAPTATPKPTNTPTPKPEASCMTLSCTNIVSKRGEYCSEHKCANSNCSYEKDYNSEYCSICSCSTLNCNNMKIESGYYCVEHTCVENECTNKRNMASDYCYSHQCWTSNCKNKQISGGYYCEEHTCAKDGCMEEKYTSDYCVYHISW